MNEILVDITSGRETLLVNITSSQPLLAKEIYKEAKA